VLRRESSNLSRPTEFFDKTEGAAEWTASGPENRGALIAQGFDPSTFRHIFHARVLLGEQVDSNPAARRSNRRPSANGERGRWQATSLLRRQAFTRDWVRFPGSPPSLEHQADTA
jgi:hypothetical protein